MFLNEFTDSRIVVSPVRHHIGYARVRKSLRHVVGEQHRLFVSETRYTPVCGDIDKHGSS